MSLSSSGALSAPRRHRVKSNDGTQLAIREWPHSNKNAATVLLLHGFPDDQTVWDKVVVELLSDYRVVTYDVRGAGESDHPASTQAYRLARLAEDFEAVLNTVAANKAVHLIAHDWGSVQSWHFLTLPKLAARVLSYTSISGPNLDYMGHMLRLRFGNASPTAIKASLQQLAHSWYVFLFQVPWLSSLPWKLGAAARWPAVVELSDNVSIAAKVGQERDAICGMRLYRANVIPALLRPKPFCVDTPSLLLVPQGDKFLTPESYDELPRFVPKLVREDVAGGHWMPLSQPSLLAERFKRFIQNLD